MPKQAMKIANWAMVFSGAVIVVLAVTGGIDPWYVILGGGARCVGDLRAADRFVALCWATTGNKTHEISRDRDLLPGGVSA